MLKSKDYVTYIYIKCVMWTFQERTVLDRGLGKVTMTTMTAGFAIPDGYTYLGAVYFRFLPHPQFGSNVCS
jgi:hypothetical protein